MHTVPMVLSDSSRTYLLPVPTGDHAVEALDRWAELGMTRFPCYNLDMDTALDLLVRAQATYIRHAAVCPAGWASVEAY